LITIIIRFIFELISEKKKLKGNFNFIRFFVGLNTVGKSKKNGNKKKTFNITGKCHDGFIKDLDNELKKKIKNSYWTKIKREISKYI
jgi:hypothetical protein